MSEVKQVPTTVTAKFPNQDELVLTLKSCKFFGFKEAKVWELFYGEYMKGKYGEDPENCSENDCHFMVIGTEYFPEELDDFAIDIFAKRAKSENPARESGRGYALDMFLEKDPAQQEPWRR